RSWRSGSTTRGEPPGDQAVHPSRPEPHVPRAAFPEQAHSAPRRTDPPRRTEPRAAVSAGVGEDLAVLRLLHQQRRRGEAVAVAFGQLARPGHEAGQAALVAVDVLQHAAGPAGEADAEDGADV